MSATEHCPKCSGPLAHEAAGGYCSKCLAALAFGPEGTLGNAVDDLAATKFQLVATKFEPPAASRSLRYFGDYELIEEIARGGMGVVWKARQVSLNRVVAVKMLLSGQFASPEFLRRFRTEAEAAANLQHPHIVAIHEVGEQDGQQYFSMDYVGGPNLAELVQDQPLPPHRAAALLQTIAEAVHYAHGRGVIHRDLKPANVLLDRQIGPRVTDFGLAKRFSSSGVQTAHVDLTLTGQLLGTPGYMSPEQVGQQDAITPASDLYSLGALLYVLVTGRAPFAAGALEETLRQVREVEPVSPRLLNPIVPRDLETICLKCLEKEPRKRYGTAHELAEELGRFLRDEPIHARPAGPAERLGRWCRRKPLVTALLLAVLVVGAAGLSGVLWQWQEAERHAAPERRQRERAEASERIATTNLWASYLAQARANRLSGRPGRRFDSLAALAKAAAIRPSPELRDETIAALALIDVRLTNNWHYVPGSQDIGGIYSPNLDCYVINGRNGEGRMHRTADNAVIGHLPSVGHSISGMGAFSPDGRWLASMGSQGALHVWDVPARRLALTDLPDQAWAFTPDSRHLLVAGHDRRVSLYDLESETLARRYPTQTVMRSCAAIDPQGRWFAGGAARGRVVTVSEFASGVPIRSFTNTAYIVCLAFSPDSRQLAVGGEDGMLEVWDTQTGERQARLEGHENRVVTVGFNHAGTLLVSSSWDNSWRMWDAREWRPLLTLPGTSYQVQFSPDDRTIAYIYQGGQVNQLALADDACLRRLQPPRRVSNSAESLDISPDGKLAAAALKSGFALWDLVTEAELAIVPAGSCASAIFTPDGTSILTSGSKGFRRWPLNRASGEGRDELRVGASEMLAEGARRFAAVSADGRWASAIQEFSDRIAVLHLDAPTQTFMLGRHPGASPVAFSPDARWLATGTWGNRDVKVWNISERRLEQVLSIPGTASVEFSPDGRWLATGSEPLLQVWATGTWREQWRFEQLEVLNEPVDGRSPKPAR